MKKNILKDEEGFTLIEIIAVLVLLGILAAVAVPRYMSVMEEAKDKAAIAAVAEGQARVNAWFGSFILSNGKVPAQGDVPGDDNIFGTDAGDFTLSYTAQASDVKVDAVGNTGTSVEGGTASDLVPYPLT